MISHVPYHLEEKERLALGGVAAEELAKAVEVPKKKIVDVEVPKKKIVDVEVPRKKIMEDELGGRGGRGGKQLQRLVE